MRAQVSHELKAEYDSKHGQFVSEIDAEPSPEQLAHSLLGATIRQVNKGCLLGAAHPLETCHHTSTSHGAHNTDQQTMSQWFKVEDSQAATILNGQMVEIRRQRDGECKVRSYALSLQK